MEVSRGVTLTYIGTAILGFILFDKFFEWMWRWDFPPFESLQQHVYFGMFPLTSIIAVGATAILIYWMKTNSDVDSFIHETVVELRKVTWPGWKDTQTSTIEVAVFTVGLAFFLWGADQLWRPVTDYILTIGH